MSIRTISRALAAMALCFLILTGVYLMLGRTRHADLIGAWRGNAGGFSISLELKEDGKGFGKLGPIPEQPLTWTAEDNKVILRLGHAPEPHNNQTADAATSGQNLVATLAQDRQSMALDIGVVQPTLHKTAR